MRSSSRLTRLAGLTAVVGMAVIGAGARGAWADSTVGMSVMTDATTFEAGKTVKVAVTLTTDPGWHIYWINAGDAGLATRITVKAPQGFDVGQTQFPVPEKFVMAGDIVAYGYTEKVTFLVDVTPPAGWTGDPAISVRASWLCCQEECVMGNGEKSLALASADVAAKNGEEIQKVEATMPTKGGEHPASITYQVKLAVDGKSETLSMHMKWKTAPAKVEVFPYASPTVLYGTAVVKSVDGHADETQVTVPADLPTRDNLAPEGVGTRKLLVVYQDSAGVRHGFNVDAPISGDQPTASVKP